MGEIPTGSTGEAQAEAAARSEAYRLFALAMAYPDEELCGCIRDGEVRDALRNCLAAIAAGLAPDDERRAALANAEAGDELAVEFTRIFDAGASGPPCPLYGGLYGGARMKTMEEAVRFYNHFGLTLSGEHRELPDHLVTQLEFLHYLAYCEAGALQAGTDPGAYQRAQRDFIARHPGAWVPELCQRLAREHAPAYYRALLASLAELLARESARLAVSAPLPPA
jgi:DMSO reductase family type II enzyme chaperone